MSTPFSQLDAEVDEPAGNLFFQSLRMNAEERVLFLDRECGSDPGLRAEVEAMLRDHEDAGSLLSVDSMARAGFNEEMPFLNPEQAGEHIGPYKLLQQIGEGGCGVVWMAEQEMPVRRRVALKVIKLGMDTKQVIARFEAERQALALMDHPNIARVLEAGATETGRPYFVMELVRGIRITTYCDQNNLPTERRLALFTQVCQAVQHAHQKGIIHRDIKPSNILVTLHDGVPVPKVIDFGIAKATTGQLLTDKTIFTAFEQFIGTPAYMSPEQAEMSGLDIDTRSDIYSLGVLLYELLTSQTPFDARELLASGLDAMRRTIREQEPPRPSTRLSTMLAADATTVARHRQTESARLTHSLRGDLDWIVMKALEKDRTRRYETASSLAHDVQRHLDSEPVTARPPSRLYRFQKFARRNRLAFAAGSAVLTALVIGLGVSSWMFFREKDARERAVAAERTQSQVGQFLREMLEGVGPSVAQGRDTVMLREILDKTAERVGSDLEDQPAVQAELRSILGNVYLDLGDYEKAETMHGKVLGLRKKLHGNEHPDVAGALNNVARVLQKQGKLAEAESMFREALGMRKRLLGIEHLEVASSLNNVGIVLRDRGKPVEAESMHREALAMRRRLFGNQGRDVAMSLSNLAIVLNDQSKSAEAEAMLKEALALYRKLYGNEHPDVANSLHNLALVLGSQGKTAEAETLAREVLSMYRKLYGNEHPLVAYALNNLAGHLIQQGQAAEAETVQREAVAMFRKQLGNEHHVVATSLRTLANALLVQNKLAESETTYREALAMQKKLLGIEHPEVAKSLSDIGLVLSKQKNLAGVEALYREELKLARKSLGDDHLHVSSLLKRLAESLETQNKLGEAEALYREALAIRRKLTENENPKVASAIYSLAKVLSSQGKLAEAESLYREALAMRRKLPGETHVEIAASLQDLSLVLSREYKLAEAETMQREALAMRRKLLGSEHVDFAASLDALAGILDGQGKRAEAEAVQREALAMQRKLLGNEHQNVASSLNNLAIILDHQNKVSESDALCRESLAMLRKLLGNEHSNVASSLLNFGVALTRQDQLPEAEAVCREALGIYRKLFGNEHPAVALSLNNLGAVLSKAGKPDEAETMYRESLRINRKLLGNEHPDVARSLENMGGTLRIQGKLKEAGTLSREALTLVRKSFDNEHPKVASALNDLAAILRDEGNLAEAEALHREALAIGHRLATDNPAALADQLSGLAETLYRENKFAEAESCYREALKSLRARLPAEHGDVTDATASLARVLADWAWSDSRSQSEPEGTGRSEHAGEAERLLRDCLSIRLGRTPAIHWRTDDVRSKLGGALLAVAVGDSSLTSEARLAKLIEAEALLLEATEGLQKGGTAECVCQRDSLVRLVRLYQAWNKPDKAAGWQRKLDDFNKAKANLVAGGKQDSEGR